MHVHSPTATYDITHTVRKLIEELEQLSEEEQEERVASYLGISRRGTEIVTTQAVLNEIGFPYHP